MRLAVPYLLPYRCLSLECKRNLELRRHITYLPGPKEPCPYCREIGHMLLLAEIHLIQSTQFGILTNSEFNQRFDNHAHDTNNRFDFLCSKAKKGFTSHVKSPNQPRHYTNVPTSATCYYCLKEYNKVAFPRGKIITEF